MEEQILQMSLPVEGGVAASWKQALLMGNEEPVDDEFLLLWQGTRFMCRGDLVSVKGKSKVGKTFAIVLLVAAYLSGEADGLSRVDEPGRVLWLDTEQRRNSTVRLLQRLRAMVGDDEAITHSLAIANVRRYSAQMRFDMLRYAMQAFHPQLIVIDNVADLIEGMAYNDNTEAARTIAELARLSEEQHCTIVCSIHENSNNDNASGWLGRILLQKCGLEFTVKKEHGRRRLCATACRDAEVEDIPFDIVANADGVLVPRAMSIQAVQADQQRARFEAQFADVRWGDGLKYAQLIDELVRLYGDPAITGDKEKEKKQCMKFGMQISRAFQSGFLKRSNDVQGSLYSLSDAYNMI